MLRTLLEYLSKNVEINAIRTLKLTNYALTQDKLALSKVIKEMLKVCVTVWRDTNSTAYTVHHNIQTEIVISSKCFNIQIFQ
jgi:hypothetical protein